MSTSALTTLARSLTPWLSPVLGVAAALDRGLGGVQPMPLRPEDTLAPDRVAQYPFGLLSVINFSVSDDLGDTTS